MQQYFDAQMRLLTQAGKQFAQHYPEHASMLNIDALKDRDPHIERLLEGVAYLTAYTQKRLDESLPEVSEQVLRQLCPILLSYYPSTCILQFSPKLMMQTNIDIARGMTVSSQSNSVNAMQCHFTTTELTSLVPLQVTGVSYKDAHNGAQIRIRLAWRCQGETADYHLNNLRFYLQGDTPLCSSLFHFLTTAHTPVTLDFGPNQTQYNRKLAAKQCNAEFMNQTGAVLPTAEKSHPGYALLLDYFNAKDRSYFVNFTGLKGIELPEDVNEFELVFHNDIKLPPGHKLSEQNIVLNCALAVNLFEHQSTPMQTEPNRTDYMVTPEDNHDSHIYCFSVNDVTARNAHTGQEYKYTSRYNSVYQEEKRLFSLVQRQVGAPFPSFYLQLPFTDSLETLSVDMTAFNGGWPRQLLQEGDINKGRHDMPNVVDVQNITRPSQFLPCPEQEKHWQLISLLNIKFSQLTQSVELRKILALFDWSSRLENRNRIDSLQAIHIQPMSIVKRGIFVKGLEVHLHVDETKFVCASDAYHFCTLLHHFFILYAPLNECVQTRVTCLPSYHEWVWEIEPGKSAQV